MDNPVAKETAKLLRALKVERKGKNVSLYRKGRGFYALRHTFETIGGEARDQVAVDHALGRSRSDTAGVYRKRISDERLKAVADYVRRWLFGTDEGGRDMDCEVTESDISAPK